MLKSFAKRLCVIVLFAWVAFSVGEDAMAQQGAAQQTGALPDSPSAQVSLSKQEKEKARREEADRELKAEEKQRIGGVVPNFNVVLGGHAVPLQPRQKFSLAMHTIIDPYTIGLAVLGGGYGEITDDHTGYGHGPGGISSG